MPETREWTMQPDAPETAHTGILRNFADAVLHGAPLLAPGEEGIHQVALTNAAYLSALSLIHILPRKSSAPPAIIFTPSSRRGC